MAREARDGEGVPLGFQLVEFESGTAKLFFKKGPMSCYFPWGSLFVPLNPGLLSVFGPWS